MKLPPRHLDGNAVFLKFRIDSLRPLVANQRRYDGGS